MTNLFLFSRRLLAIFALFLAVLALTSCKSVTNSDTVDYKSAGAVRGRIRPRRPAAPGLRPGARLPASRRRRARDARRDAGPAPLDWQSDVFIHGAAHVFLAHS